MASHGHTPPPNQRFPVRFPDGSVRYMTESEYEQELESERTNPWIEVKFSNGTTQVMRQSDFDRLKADQDRALADYQGQMTLIIGNLSDLGDSLSIISGQVAGVMDQLRADMAGIALKIGNDENAIQVHDALRKGWAALEQTINAGAGNLSKISGALHQSSRMALQAEQQTMQGFGLHAVDPNAPIRGHGGRMLL
jgi:hypothetical protein